MPRFSNDTETGLQHEVDLIQSLVDTAKMADCSVYVVSPSFERRQDEEVFSRDPAVDAIIDHLKSNKSDYYRVINNIDELHSILDSQLYQWERGFLSDVDETFWPFENTVFVKERKLRDTRLAIQFKNFNRYIGENEARILKDELRLENRLSGIESRLLGIYIASKTGEVSLALDELNSLDIETLGPLLEAFVGCVATLSPWLVQQDRVNELELLFRLTKEWYDSFGIVNESIDNSLIIH